MTAITKAKIFNFSSENANKELLTAENPSFVDFYETCIQQSIE